MLAEAHDWTPEQIDAMDPDYIAELLIQKEARADHQLFESDLDAKSLEAKRKKMQTQRRIELMNRRDRGSKR